MIGFCRRARYEPECGFLPSKTECCVNHWYGASFARTREAVGGLNREGPHRRTRQFQPRLRPYALVTLIPIDTALDQPQELPCAPVILGGFRAKPTLSGLFTHTAPNRQSGRAGRMDM
jgi:hypothetical protein